MMLMCCARCFAIFEPRRSGGRPQIFCSQRCGNKAWQSKRVRKERGIHLRMDPHDFAFVRKKSKKTGVSMAEIVRTYVSWGVDIDARS